MKHLGDITKIHGDLIEPVDCIAGGSPCQDLSIAGKRAGLSGKRSGLFMEMIRIIKEMRNVTNGEYPKFAIWENVRGALSSNGGEDFRCVLEEFAHITESNVTIPRPSGKRGKWSKSGAISGNGWSLAWRLFDAQYWGVPQRRQRIALVMDFGGQRAPEILFERTSLSGNPDESIKAWESTAGIAKKCATRNDSLVGEVIPINTQISTRYKSLGERTGLGVGESGDPAYTLQAAHEHGVCYCIQGNVANRLGSTKMNVVGVAENVSYDVTGTLRAQEHGHQPIIFDALPFDTTQVTSPKNGCSPKLGDPCHPLAASAHTPTVTMKVFDNHAQDARYSELKEVCPTATARWGTGGGNTPIVVRHTFNEQSFSSYNESDKCSTLKATGGNVCNGSECLIAEKVIHRIVRRLTPVECERLQGFPDNWTNIGDWIDTKGKKHRYADSPRYKALGNSIALPQWFWLVQKMRPYLRKQPMIGSLFDGIGGFPLVWETAYGSGTAKWASEIEEFPIAITKVRFPE